VAAAGGRDPRTARRGPLRFHEAAVAELNDDVGDVEQERVVRGHDRRDALAPDELAYELHDLERVGRIELCSRLVRDQKLGAVGERPADGHPLLLASRELVGPVAGPPGEAHEVEKLADAAVAFRGVDLAEAERNRSRPGTIGLAEPFTGS
jgi:hypothetical protein